MKQHGSRLKTRWFFVSVVLIAVQMQRQSRYGLRQYPDAGVHRRHLHRRTLGHGFAGRAAAEGEAVPAAVCRVHGLVAGTEQAGEYAHERSAPL